MVYSYLCYNTLLGKTAETGLVSSLCCSELSRVLLSPCKVISLTLVWLPQCTGQQTGNRAKRGRGKPVLQDMKNNVAILLKRLRFERYGVKTGEKANTHNQHWLTSTRFSQFSAQAKISMIQVHRCSKLTHDDRSRS